jgi:hypothetical protein
MFTQALQGRSHLSLLGFLAFGIIGSATTSRMQAAPVTLQFTAHVGGVLQTADGFLPPTWPSAIQQGSLVSGSFTFEPVDVASSVKRTDVESLFDFSITVGSRTLLTSRFGISVRDDDPTELDPEFVDSISVGRSTYLPDESGGDPLGWASVRSFYGDAAVLNGADIPADPEPWRRLLLDDSLSVFLIDPSVQGSYGFFATLQTLELIPEPGNGTLVSCGIGVIILLNRLSHAKTVVIKSR